MIEDWYGLTLSRCRSSRHTTQHISDLDFADDITHLSDMLSEPELRLHKVETSARSIGLVLNAEKTKHMHINPSAECAPLNVARSLIERVNDFKYFGSNTTCSVT